MTPSRSSSGGTRAFTAARGSSHAPRQPRTRARESIRRFVNGRDDDAVITRNTTDSINLLAGTLPEGTHVVCFAGEHHANLLPWKRIGVSYLPVPESPAALLETLTDALPTCPTAMTRTVAVTGASNVTGEIWLLAEIARVAHDHGARLLVDAAQLAPHAPIDMQRDGIDRHVGSQALRPVWGRGTHRRAGLALGRRSVPARGRRREARHHRRDPVGRVPGSPRPARRTSSARWRWALPATLAAAGMDRVAEERDLAAYAVEQLGSIDGFQHSSRLGRGPPADRPADLQPRRHAVRPAGCVVLSAEHGIGIRHGCFCAHPLMVRLLRVDDDEVGRLMREVRGRPPPESPGAARMSLGLGSTRADIDAMADALRAIAAHGPR